MKIVIDLRMIKPFPTGVGTYLDNIAYNLFLIDGTNTYIVLHNDPVLIKRLYAILSRYVPTPVGKGFIILRSITIFISVLL